jgi:hypothetical protein
MRFAGRGTATAEVRATATAATGCFPGAATAAAVVTAATATAGFGFGSGAGAARPTATWAFAELRPRFAVSKTTFAARASFGERSCATAAACRGSFVARFARVAPGAEQFKEELVAVRGAAASGGHEHWPFEVGAIAHP